MSFNPKVKTGISVVVRVQNQHTHFVMAAREIEKSSQEDTAVNDNFVEETANPQVWRCKRTCERDRARTFNCKFKCACKCQSECVHFKIATVHD